MPTSTEENRQFHRIFCQRPALLTLNTQQWSCHIIDISLNGCLLKFITPWENNTPDDTLYTLTLALSDDVTITLKLKINHVIEDKVGFKCEYIDLDSISSLRRLIELNLGDSRLLERDFLALIH